MKIKNGKKILWVLSEICRLTELATATPPDIRDLADDMIQVEDCLKSVLIDEAYSDGK